VTRLGNFVLIGLLLEARKVAQKIAPFTLNKCHSVYDEGRVARLGNFVLIGLLLEAQRVAQK
jgi:hypothetical protein